MTQPVNSTTFPVTWIKVWIAAGIAALAIILLLPAFLSYALEQERTRLEACRKDKNCQSLPIWSDAAESIEKRD